MESDGDQGPPNANEPGQYRSRRERAERPTKRNTPAWRRARFVRAYVVNGGNATQAAITAGFTHKSADVMGSRLLNEPEVAAEIAKLGETLKEDEELNIARVLKELCRMATYDARDFFDKDGRLLSPHEWTPAMGAVVSSIDTEEVYQGKGKHRRLLGYTRKLRLASKADAVDKAMKYLGLFEQNNTQKAGKSRSLEIVFVPGPKRDSATVIEHDQQPERMKLPSRVRRDPTGS